MIKPMSHVMCEANDSFQNPARAVTWWFFWMNWHMRHESLTALSAYPLAPSCEALDQLAYRLTKQASSQINTSRNK